MRLGNVDGSPAVLDGDRAHLLSTFGAGPGSFIDAITRWSEVPELLVNCETVDVSSAALGPPVPRPGKILGAPVNYHDHRREMNAAHTIAGLGFFLKSPTSVIGADGAVPLPLPDRRTDQEAELGVVIGRRAEHVPAATALDHVFGYTCLVDVTVRGDEERSTRKSFPGFTPIGPWVTTTDEVPDPSDLRIRGWVNGELRQDSSTAHMIFGVAELIEFMSSVVPLEPGDIIATGTPAGVGPIVDGDTIEVEIDRIGRLVVRVESDRRPAHRLWHGVREAHA